MPLERDAGASVNPQYNGETFTLRIASSSLFLRLKLGYYHCRRCNYSIPKKEARVSGYDSQNSLRHVHCPNCGKVVAWSPGESRIRSITEGVCFTAAGSVLAFLLYPAINIYGLQAGFAASLYGILKILFL
jgi:NAD-dependent SIR2 family protein deacetylase